MVLGKLPRSVFHMFGTALAPGLALFVPQKVFLIGLGAATGVYLAFEITRLLWRQVNRWFFAHCLPLLRGNEASRLTGVSYIMAASLIAFLVFPREIAVISLAFLAVGDPLSGLIGPWGRRWLLGKTMEGHLAFFLPSVAAGLALGYFLFGLSPLIPVIGAAMATLIHALPLPVNDNFSIPLASAIAMAVAGMWV